MKGGDEIVIYTPGHSLYTDTLIAYGISYPTIKRLKEVADPEEVLRVIGTGMNYAIIIKEANIDLLAEAIASYVAENSDSFKRELKVTPKSEAKTRADGRIGLFSEKDVSEFVNALTNESEIKKYLENLRSPEHAENEGKLVKGRGGGAKLKLPLMPTAGKYLTQDLTTTCRYSDNKYYKVCEYCAAFAALGLYCGALAARFREWAMLIFLGFEGEVGGGTLNYAFDLVRSEAEALASLSTAKEEKEETQKTLLSIELSRSIDALPLRTLSQATLCLFADSAIKGMSESDASWKSLSVKFDASRAMSGNLQVRGYEEVILTPVLNALADLLRGSGVGGFRERVMWLLRAARSNRPESGDAVTALESLFTFFQTRRLSDLYSFARSYEASMRRFAQSINYKFYLGLSIRICKELARLSVKT